MVYQLTNVPTKASGLEVDAIVEGENIRIVCRKKGSAPDDCSTITTVFLGDHMLSKPGDLRQMYARDIVSAIEQARDIGHNHAKRELQQWLEIPRS